MKQLEKLIDRVIARVNVNLRTFSFDAEPYAKDVVPFKQMLRFNAFYGVTSHHPLHVNFKNSSLAGSYFLGKCLRTTPSCTRPMCGGTSSSAKGTPCSSRARKCPWKRMKRSISRTATSSRP